MYDFSDENKYEKDFIYWMQSCRHDLMNHLQVIDGYLSMKKEEKAEQLVEELIAYYREERKLIQLSTVKFILWIVRFDKRYKNMQLTYNVQAENVNLSKYDVQLIEQCEYILECSKVLIDEAKLYQVHLELHKHAADQLVEVSLSISGNLGYKDDFSKQMTMETKHFPVIIENNEFEAKIVYRFFVPY